MRTPGGSVRAPYVVRATEGFTPRLPGLARAVVPVYSLIIATEPLPAEVWDEIGLARRETFSDHRHLIIYGQRTADDRLVFGGRGAPYHFGSQISPGFDRDQRVFAGLHATLLDLFPVLHGTRFTHAWGGPLGIPRDWCASVGLDRGTGLAWAGGYVGDGVSTTNLAGRTLRDLVLDRATELTALPWVGHRSPDVGARAAALARHQRRPPRDDARRRRGAADPAALGDRAGDGAAGRRTLGLVPEDDGRVQKRALVRRPGPRLAEGLLTHLERVPVDMEMARRQWHGYAAALQAEGWELYEVEPADDCPDAVFVEDTVVVYGDLAVITRPGADQRKPETAGTEQALLGLGYRIAAHRAARHPRRRRRPQARRHRLGRARRTHQPGRPRPAAPPTSRRSAPPSSSVPVTKVLHLKSAVTALPDGTVIGYEPLVDDPTAWPSFLPVPRSPGPTSSSSTARPC